MKANTSLLRSDALLPAVGGPRPQPPRRQRCAVPAHTAHSARFRSQTQGRDALRSARCNAAAAEAREAAPKAPLPGIDVQEEQEGSHVRLRVTVPAAHARKAWDKALRKAASKLNVPGFRPGKKIPESVLFQYADEEEIKRDAIQALYNNSIKQVTSGYKDKAFGASFRLDDDGEELMKAFTPANDLRYTVSFDVSPPLKWTRDYHKLQVTVERPCPPGTEARLAEMQLAQAVKEAARLRIVTGRGLQPGDVAVIDFEARDAGSGEPIAGTKREGLQLDTTLPENSLGLPGLARAAEGMAAGESKSVSLEVPESWWDAERRGSTITANVTVRELFVWDLPELNDSLARQLMPTCAGLADLRAQLTAAAAALVARQQAEAVNVALAMAVAECVDLEVPEALIREMGQNEYQAQLLQAQTAGSLDVEAIKDLATEEMLDRFIESRREQLTQLQRGIIGFEEIFKQEGLVIGEEEIQKEVDSAMADAAANGEEMDRELLTEQVHEVLKAAKVLEWLTDNADITFVDPEPEEAEEAEAAAPAAAQGGQSE